MPMQFPGHVIKVGEGDEAVVRTIQHRLNEMGCGPVEEDGDFDEKTENAVKLFQARFTDLDGIPLKVDGKVGPLTWGALFGEQSVPTITETPSPLLMRVLRVAAAEAEMRVMEQPLGSNRGPRVDEYLRAVGLNPSGGSFAWCVAFIYFCFDQAAKQLGRSNPMIKTAGVLDHWNKAGQRKIPRLSRQKAVDNPNLVKPGHIFVIDTGGGHGHTGLVEKLEGGKLLTIEGNTNEGGSREGIGVFRRDKRKITEINKGFIDYSSL